MMQDRFAKEAAKPETQELELTPREFVWLLLFNEHERFQLVFS
jgi:hypothetical protein